MLDLQDIRAFVEVAEAGGFNRAARKLAVSPSIVSRRLARLEEELGARLLTRTTRGVALTEAGEGFRLRAQRILAEIEAAREAVAETGEEIAGSLRIAAPLSFGTLHLAPVLAEFAARHPRLSLETDYSERFVNLIAERFDAAIRIGTLPDSSLIVRRIAPIYAAILASPAYLAEHGEPKSVADLERHSAVRQPGEVWRFTVGRREVSLRPPARLESNSGRALVDAAKAGLGVTILPTFIASEAVEAGALVRILPEARLPEAALYVVRPPPAKPVPAKLRALIDLMVERFGGEPHWDACWRARNGGG